YNHPCIFYCILVSPICFVPRLAIRHLAVKLRKAANSTFRGMRFLIGMWVAQMRAPSVTASFESAIVSNLRGSGLACGGVKGNEQAGFSGITNNNNLFGKLPNLVLDEVCSKIAMRRQIMRILKIAVFLFFAAWLVLPLVRINVVRGQISGGSGSIDSD